MIFNTGAGTIICCKDKFYKNFYDSNYFYINNKKTYFKGYVIHKEDGPAVKWSDGVEEWWLNGRRYSEEKYYKIVNLKSKSRVLDDI